jgi:hypothetical protein
MIPLRVFALAVLLMEVLPAQQLLWQTPAGPPSTVQYNGMVRFADYNRDGYLDLP